MWWARLLNQIAAIHSVIKAGLPTANLYAQYDFSDSSKVSLSGSSITQILDSSGNGRTLTQGTSTKQPTLLTADQNGLNTASFDGTTDLLISATGLTAVTNASLYGVFRIGAGNTTGMVFAGVGLEDTERLRAFYTPASASNMNLATYGNAYASTLGNDAGGSYHAWAGIADQTGSNASVQKDGTLQTASFNGYQTPSSSTITLGGLPTILPATVKIGEILIYNTAHGTTDRTAVMDYLKAKWGTP